MELIFLVNLLRSFISQPPVVGGATLPLSARPPVPNPCVEMKVSVVLKKLWSVHKQLVLLLTPLIFLPLLFTLPEKVRTEPGLRSRHRPIHEIPSSLIERREVTVYLFKLNKVDYKS